MGNNTKVNRQKKAARKKLQFWSTKASVVSGIVGITAMIIKLCEIFGTNIPKWVVILLFFGILALFGVVLGTKKWDKHLSSKGAENFGTLLTVFSVVVYLIEDLLFRLLTDIDTDYKIICCTLTVVMVGGAIYLLFAKYND